MNTNWSDYIQGINTLYLSRKLRFSDCFFPQYDSIFQLPKNDSLKLLEIGCGPGALAAALRRWYPNYEIFGLDRDTHFIEYAQKYVPGVHFLEGDAMALPFDDGSFDISISNTVSEHIEPSAFFGEQHRILKEGGVCLVLSARRGIHVQAACLENNVLERAFWEKVEKYDTSMADYQVCQYPMTEAELPAVMEHYGFKSVTCGYAVLPMTPDDPRYPSSMAIDMIEAARANALDAVSSAERLLPKYVSREEANVIRKRINDKYNHRIKQYRNGDKQWNTSVSITMIVRGVKI